MRALVIDDSRTQRLILSRALRTLNIEADEASNGRVALAAVASGERPDVVLLDWHMPEMDGVEFLREARRRDALPGVPIVMVTSESGDEELDDALAAGASEYIFKPVTVEALRSKLVMMGLPIAE